LDKLLANHTTRFDPTNLSAIPAPPIIEITSPGPKIGKTELLYWIIAGLVLGSDTHGTPEDIEPHQADESPTDQPRNTQDHTMNHETTDSEAQTGDNDTNLETDIPQHPSPEQSDHHIPTPSTNTHKEPHNHNHTHHTNPTTIALLTTSPADLPRLTQILFHRLLSTTPNLPLSTAQELIHTSLSHIHIFQPSSLSSLIATISSLPSYFLDPKNGSVERRVGAIIIDSASTFFWADKAATTGQTHGQGQGQAQSKYPALASTLRRTSTTLQAPVFFSTENLSSTPSTSNTSNTSSTSNISSTSAISSSNPLAIRPHLPSPWPTLPTLRLIISKNTIQNFPKDIDAETAVRHAEARDKAVGEAGFSVKVNKWGGDGQRERESEADGNKGFGVRIDGKGVTLL
jgi:hypothetical protein